MDTRDRKIIAVLQRDGRATLSEIGEAIGLSSMGAKKRVDKLVAKDLIKIKVLSEARKVLEDSNFTQFKK